MNFTNVKVTDKLIKNRMDVATNTTLNIFFDKCKEYGRIKNLENAINNNQTKYDGMCFNDSDIYKLIEGMSYAYANTKNAELLGKMNGLIDMIENVQEEDGYLDALFQLYPEGRFFDMDAHELYVMGHMIESACANFISTGETKLLNVAIKCADMLVDTFGNDKKRWVPGHAEIELALIRLFGITKNDKYVRLAFYFLEEHGNNIGAGSIGDEGDKLGVWDYTYKMDTSKPFVTWDKKYHLDEMKLSDLSIITGHAVRAMYTLVAMSELENMEIGNYKDAMDRIWNNIVNKNMYISGGIGSSSSNEGFIKDYELNNIDSYCETCASIGMVYWNYSMAKGTEKWKYNDVIEREIFNGALSGMSIDGTKYFYDNPMESDGDKDRKEWFECTCCPSQIARFYPIIGNYIYEISEEVIYINQWISSEYDDGEEKITLDIDYLKSGILKIETNSTKKIKLRTVRYANLMGEYQIEDGYLILEGSKVYKIEYSISPLFIKSNENVELNVGKIAVTYGPFVMCAEEVDNVNFDNLKITVNNCTTVNIKQIKDFKIPELKISENTFIPYFYWNNRGKCKMKVFFNKDDKYSLYTNL